MKNIRTTLILSLVALFAIIMQLPQNGSNVVLAQANLKQPNVTTSGTAVSWTAGTLNNGGHAVTVVAGSAALTTSKTDCAAPGYLSCNLVYSNSAGTVAVTTALATASADGNSLMAYVETSGSAVTKLAFPLQASTSGLPNRVVQNCGTTVTCANTAVGASLKTVFGSVALASASPSTAILTTLPFTSSTSYVCTALPVGNTAAIAAAGVAITQSFGTSVTFTGPNTVTTVINYTCFGT